MRILSFSLVNFHILPELGSFCRKHIWIPRYRGSKPPQPTRHSLSDLYQNFTQLGKSFFCGSRINYLSFIHLLSVRRCWMLCLALRTWDWAKPWLRNRGFEKSQLRPPRHVRILKDGYCTIAHNVIWNRYIWWTLPSFLVKFSIGSIFKISKHVKVKFKL